MKRLLVLLVLLATSSAWAEFSPAAFLGHYGWQMAGEPKRTTIDVPQELTGPAFTLYQLHCERAGLSLEPFRGRKAMPFLVCPLTRKTSEGFPIKAYLVVDQDKVVGAWLAIDGPVAPGLGAVSDAKFGQATRR